jgi:uncharacterized protein (DUF1684 family)
MASPQKYRRWLLPGILSLLVAMQWLTAAPVFAAGIDPNYRASFEKWKAEQLEDLKQNWLPLAGLFWLRPGASSFGSDPNNDIILPKESAPGQAGTFEFSGGVVTVAFRPGVPATIDGKVLASARLRPDISGSPSVVEMGSLRLHVIQRGQRTGIRLKDLNSAAVRAYRGPIFFALDPAYRITATWVPADGKRMVDVPNVLGDTTPTPAAGEVRFRINGQAVHLTDLGGDPSKGLFIVFNDLTSKSETYPGGRFLETGPVANGAVVLDFNRAHNPPCAVTAYATCPLAPKENRLAIAIPAGEKYDRAHTRH